MALPYPSLTLEEFLRLPERKPALEYVDGRIRQKVIGDVRHSALQSFFISYFAGPGMRQKVARAFPRLRTVFGGHARVVDMAVFRWPRIPRDAHGKLADDCLVPPDVAIEIISPEEFASTLTQDCEW